MEGERIISLDLAECLIQRIRQLSVPMEPKPTGIAARLRPLRDIQAVLFDVYGTLVISDSEDISITSEMSKPQALTEALQCTGFSGKLDEAGAKGTAWLLQAIQQTHARQRQAGIVYPEVDIREEWEIVLQRLQQGHLLEGEITTETVMRVSVEYEYRVNPVWPMPDVSLTLQTLQAQGCMLGIVSNAQFYTLLLFPAFLGKSYIDLGFDPNVCAWSFQLREAKPSAHLFRGIVERLQDQYRIVPAQTLYVGNDKLNDILPAAQCSLKTALFAGDQRSLRLRETDACCADLEPDLIVTRLSQIPERLF
jgi:putative hydrolase of the HAD superfamily